MIIQCWNVRGLNSPLKQHEVVHLMKKNKVDVCGLLESKMLPSKVAAMHSFRLKHWKFLTNASGSSLAHIVVPWNPSTVQVDLVGSSSQGLHVIVFNLVSQIRFHVSFVYGLHTIVARRALSDSLCSWSPPGPWMVLGDFNSFLSQDDKLNGSAVSMYEIADFNKCCLDLGLYDLNYTGCHFTQSAPLERERRERCSPPRWVSPLVVGQLWVPSTCDDCCLAFSYPSCPARVHLCSLILP